MVGTVLVSHSKALVDALAEVVRLMAPEAPVAVAGGLEDGSFGTSYEAIERAIGEVSGPDGVVVIVDLGSSVLTTKMVLEDLGRGDVRLADCPFVEGAIEATVRAQAGADIASIIEGLAALRSKSKL